VVTTVGRRRIGVDVDGVLADHVTALIPRVLDKYGVELRWEEANQWRLPLGDSDIGVEFVEAMVDLEWVAGIPVYQDAAEAVGELASVAEVVIITARPPVAAEATQAWLHRHQVPYDQFMCGPELDRNRQDLAMLVDDYVGNIYEFVAHTAGIGVLLDRPWNRDDREDLGTVGGTGRFYVVQSLREVVGLL